MISRLHINSFRRLFVFRYFYQFFTTADPAQPSKNHFMVNYLINSLGLSKDEALSATKNVRLYKSSKNDPDLVVSFLKKLGLNRTQIRSIASSNPRLLTCNVEKTLQSKVLVLQEIGISGSDLISVLMAYKFLLDRGQVSRPIEYLRNLLGSKENVAHVIKKFSSVLDGSSPKRIESNVQLLQKHSVSREHVTRFILQSPRIFLQKPKRLQDILYVVENEFGIPWKFEMFYYGVIAASTLRKTTIDMKVGLLRSFGFSYLTIYSMINRFPSIVRASEDKLRKAWNFFTKEIGYSPDFLASHPVVFNLSLEKRVRPRYEVLKLMNEKNFRKRKVGLYTILCMSESTFVDEFLLPCENEIPDMVGSYFKIVGRKKT